uniref:DUF3060 domain-containing protein n=1 Tax=Gongylonema pulchrum TaxID=637853 RepID=A0A183EV67_9BILA
LVNGNGAAMTEPRTIINSYVNSSDISSSVNKVVRDEQLNGVKELSQSPSATKRQYNSSFGNANFLRNF